MSDVKYYVMQVWTGREDKFISKWYSEHPDKSARLHFLKAARRYRAGGKFVVKNERLFPSYVFMTLDGEDSLENYRATLYEAEGFFQFLPTNTGARPLKESEVEIPSAFMKGEATAKPAKAAFDENQRIVILDGIFEGREGLITKVDRRRRLYCVSFACAGANFSTWLPYELADTAKTAETKVSGKNKKADKFSGLSCRATS
jgi:transcription antitermination factor NusG